MNITPKIRSCQICNSNDLEPIHRQHFLFPEQETPVHYDVVTCKNCGFGFASEIPDQSVLNQFYQTSEHHLHTSLPPGLASIHREFFDFIQEHIEPKPSSRTRVLDIGAGMGHFLNHFRQSGLRSLLGIEPSSTAAKLGREVYGLEIKTETIDTLQLPESFDLITLCGVLEHIADLKNSLLKINALMQEGGHLFIAVPDVATFGDAPPKEAFLEFALEHINFFSATSLDNLLSEAGFTSVHVESRHNDFYGNSYLFALYRKTGIESSHSAPQTDLLAAASLHTYVTLSQQILSPTASTIGLLADSKEPLIIWGAGSLTSRLFCDTALKDTNIVGIIDRNKALHNRKLLGFPISGTQLLNDHPGVTILVASTTYADEIKSQLINEHSWQGKIITLIQDKV